MLASEERVPALALNVQMVVNMLSIRASVCDSLKASKQAIQTLVGFLWRLHLVQSTE